MRNTIFSHIKLGFLFVFTLCSCQKSRTLITLSIRNQTQETIFFESDIVPAFNRQLQKCGNIEPANDNFYTIYIAEAEFKGFINYKLNIEDLIVNKESASIRLYTYDNNENKTKVKEWKYTERNLPGRQLFNSNYVSGNMISEERGVRSYFYIFDILPEDIGH